MFVEEEGYGIVNHVLLLGITVSSSMKASEIMTNGCVKTLDTMCFFLGLNMFFFGKKFFVCSQVIGAIVLAGNIFHFVPEFSSRPVITVTGLEVDRFASLSIISNP